MFALDDQRKPPLYSHMAGASEHEIQGAILEYLQRCSKVAFAHRQNTGQTKYTDESGKARWVRYGWVGCSDIIGMLTDGRFLAVEVKSKRGRVSDEQAAFLQAVSAGGGVALLARSVDDVINALQQHKTVSKNGQLAGNTHRPATRTGSGEVHSERGAGIHNDDKQY